MKKFRSFLLILSFGIFGIGAVFFNFFIFPLLKYFFKGQKLYEKYSDIIQKTWKFFVYFLIYTSQIRLDIKNLEEIKSIKNKIIVSTHPSFIDVVILIALIPRSTCFVKKELAQNPILNNLINSIFITNAVDLGELKRETKIMSDMGFNIIIFPSGIRHRRFEYPKIKKGASLIALNSGKNIVPIKMFTDEDFLFINQPFYEVGDKIVTYEIEKFDEININDFYNKSKIIMKREITKQIKKSLYR